MDYIAELGRKPTILLVEDNEELRKEYKQSLKEAGFYVVDIEDGSKLELALTQIRFNVILSDTELDKKDGDVACKSALEKNLIGKNVLILGMSDNIENEKVWEGIAHSFIYKSTYASKQISRDIGEAVMLRYRGFLKRLSSTS